MTLPINVKNLSREECVMEILDRLLQARSSLKLNRGKMALDEALDLTLFLAGIYFVPKSEHDWPHSLAQLLDVVK